jgi:hypothetical protein
MVIDAESDKTIADIAGQSCRALAAGSSATAAAPGSDTEANPGM